MTAKTTQTPSTTAGDDPSEGGHTLKKGGPPDPLPEQRPWLTEEDTRGWRTVYRGAGRRGQVRSSVVVELTPEQREWLDRTGRATGLLRHQLIAKLIDDARLADPVIRAEPADAAK
jgi:hypothetical protein